MKARLLDVTAPECAAILQGAPHDFYHLPPYVQLSAVHEGGVAKALLVQDGGRQLYLPLVARTIPGSRLDATSPYGYPGPIIRGTDDPSFATEALDAGGEALQEAGFVSLFVRFHPLLNDAAPRGMGLIVRHGVTVSIDLRLPESTFWRQMRRNHRRDINQAIQRGLVARVDHGFDRYDDFRQLYRATMERREAAPYYRFRDEYFNGLRHALGDRLHLCVVEDGAKLAAASLFVETHGIVEHHLMGSDSDYGRGEATKLMVHFIASWSRERGNAVFHLGGGVGAAEDSLLHFKMGFSPRQHPFYTLRVVLDDKEYERLVEAHDPTLDPSLVSDFFPAYRSP